MRSVIVLGKRRGLSLARWMESPGPTPPVVTPRKSLTQLEGGVATPSAAASRRSRVRDSAVEEDVRRLVARELHDRVAQTLTGMLVDVENFKSEQVGWDDVIRQMDTIQTSTRQVLSSLRQLLH